MSAKVLAGVGGVMLFLLALALAAPSPTLTVSIPAGHEGVLYERLAGGTNVQRAYDEGLHFLWPWNSMYVYDARFQTRSATYSRCRSSESAKPMG